MDRNSDMNKAISTEKNRQTEEEFFVGRLIELRADREVSARKMSIDLQQNSSYINRIENKKAFPSMQLFFDICEYLHVTPGQFFDRGGVPAEISEELKELFVLMQKLTPGQREIIRSVAEEFLAAGSAKEPSEAVR